MARRVALWSVARASLCLLLLAALAGCAVKVRHRAPKEAAPTRSIDAGVEGLVPLKLELPKPAFMSCMFRAPPGVEKHTGKPRPPFMVPAGTRNVALGKAVTTSDYKPVSGSPELVTDGDKEGRKKSCLLLGSGPRYVQIDLGTERDIHAVVIWHYHWTIGVCHDVVVQVADERDFVIGVRTLFNNDHDNSLGLGVGEDREYIETYEGKLIKVKDAKGVRTRYVRWYANGSTADDMNRFTEMEIYGKPAGGAEELVPLKLELPRPAFM